MLMANSLIVSLKDNVFEASNGTKVFWDSDGEFYEWFISNDAVNNRTGRWYLTIISMDKTVNSTVLDLKTIDKNLVKPNISGDYYLRTFHTGCYYFNRGQWAWVADGVKVIFLSIFIHLE